MPSATREEQGDRSLLEIALDVHMNTTGSCEYHPDEVAEDTATLRKAVKTLTEAKADFEKGGRADLVVANDGEIKLLEKYLPQGLADAQLDALLAEVIAATGATSRKEMGKVMGALKQHPQAGLIDFGAVSKRFQAKLP